MKKYILILSAVATIISCENNQPGMVFIPEGEFILGVRPTGETTQFISDMTLSLNAQPAQKIHLEGFFIDQHETTYRDFRRFKPQIEYPIKNPREPIRGISWYEADAYCLSQEKRLPTETEWEKAARGPDERLFVWGSEFNSKYANFGKKVQPIGLSPNDKSTYGLADMNGNVSEWTANWYKPYPKSKFKDNYFGRQVKVLRGGSFHKTEHGFMKEFAMLPYRNFAPPDDRFWDTGFRCAKSF